MKRCNFYWFTGILALSLLFFNSCNKLDENQLYIESPFITFVEFDGSDTLNIVSEDDTVILNVPFGIFVSATSNLLTNEYMKSITVSVSMEGATYDSIYPINDTIYSNLHIFLPEKIGIRQISFTVIDNAGNKASKSIKLLVRNEDMNAKPIPSNKNNSNASNKLLNSYYYKHQNHHNKWTDIESHHNKVSKPELDDKLLFHRYEKWDSYEIKELKIGY